MTKGEAKLLGVWNSAYVIRVRIAFHLKKVEYEFAPEPDWGKSELLVKSNPVYKKMPVLIHDGKPLCESAVIVQYIDETWGGHALLPSDEYERACARFWTYYIDDKVIPIIRKVRFAETDKEQENLLWQSREGLKQMEEAFISCSKGKSFFGGDTIGLVDLAMGSYLGWIKATEKFSDVKLLEAEKTPQLCAWADRFLAEPAVKKAIPEVERFIEVCQVMKEMVAAGTLAKK